MLKLFQFKSIQRNIIVGMMIVVSLILIITIGLAFSFTKSAVEDNAKEYTIRLIDQVERNIDYYLKEMNNIANAISYNFDVSEYFSRTPTRELHDKIQQEVNGMMSNRNDISSVSIFGLNEHHIVSSNKQLKEYIDLTEKNWYKEALSNPQQSVLSGSHVQNIYENEYLWVITLSKELLDLQQRDSIGVLSIDLNYKIIDEICNEIKLGESGYIYIVDGDGELIYHPKQRLINSGIENEYLEETILHEKGSFIKGKGQDEKLYTVKLSSYSGWRIVGVSYTNEFVENTGKLWTYYMIVIIVALAVAIFISNLIAKTISKPVKELKMSMEEIRDRNLDQEVEIKVNNEIGDLSHTFNEMTHEIKTLIDEKTVEQKKKRKSELKALQAQINPHFLYNTLDSIIWMAVENKNDEVVEMTSALAKMYRLSISKGEEMITVDEEMHHIKNYLIIQKFRYGDKMDYSIEFDNDIRHLKTLKILLQPIIENSIYHGLKNKIGSGHIWIHGYKENRHLVFEVRDDGVGMKPEVLENIFNVDSETGNGVGVKNVNERIKLYFGQSYGLEYTSELEVGTTVRVVIPCYEEVQDEI